MANVEKAHSQTETGEIGGVSTMLHTARMRAGIELGDVAERLRIRFAYLEAIEEGRFSDLPGPTYALGFVRAYADFLELDGREIVRQFKEEGQGLSRRQELVFPEPIQEGRFPGTQLVIAALVLAGLVYGGWYYWQHRRNHTMAEVAPVPPNLAGLIHPKEGAREKPAATASTSAKPEAEPATEAASTPTTSAPTASSPTTSAATAPASAPSSNTAATAPAAASETSTANGGSSASTAPTQPEDQDTVPQAPTPLATTASNAPAGSASEATPAPSAPETSSASSAAPESSTPNTSNAASSKTASSSSGASAPSMPVAEIPKPEPPPARASSNSAAPGAIAPTSAKAISANSESASVAKTEAAKAQTTKTETAKAQATKAETAQPASAAKAPASEAQLAARPSEPHIFGAVEGGSHVTLIARQDSWLQVRDKTGQVIWTRILRAGESYKVPNEPGLTLATGNAGALEVTVDGKSVPALGAVGAVRRNISLDPAKLVAGTAAGQ